jgi:hypothetical protein
MNRTRSSLVRSVAWLLCVLLAGIASAQQPDVVVGVRTDRDNALYACNENATFLVSMSDRGQPVTEGQVYISLTRDFTAIVDQQHLPLGQQPAGPKVEEWWSLENHWILGQLGLQAPVPFPTK